MRKGRDGEKMKNENEMKKKNYETYNNERKETCFCKFKQISDRKRRKAGNMHIVTDSK